MKDGWKIVKFGEIARNISERVDPLTTDLDVYVGLEHLDPQSLRITRRGVPTDVKGQKLRVRPGQIIFGKRRAYQKKVAVADFDGICSAHAMVLEPVPGKIIPELLPFFMQSDMFMDRAVAISEGSLSPTIKWKTLANQEFPLPPVERQKRILEVLEKLEEAIQVNSDVQEKANFLKYMLQFRYFKVPKRTKGSVRIREVSSFITSGSRDWAKYYSSSGDLFLRITNLQKGTVEIDLSDSKYVKLPISN
jgi:type I restriction enzyme S subunit